MTISSEKDREKDTVSSTEVPELRSALRWYLFGFSLLGGAVGYFAGSSQSPVIGTLLPLLFGLIGGAGGLYLTRAELDRPEVMFRLRILGKALTLFIILTLVGSVYGISLRTERSIRDFFSPIGLGRKSSLGISIKGDPMKTVQLAMLRARIRTLGVSLDEEQQIIEGAVELIEASDFAMTDTASSLNRLEMLAMTAHEVLTKTILEHPCQSGSDLLNRSCRGAEGINDYLRAYAEDCHHCATKIKNGEKIPITFVKNQLDGAQAILKKLLHDGGGAALWLLQYDDPRQRILELQWALIDEREKLGSQEWLEGGSLTEELDRFLTIFYGSGAVKAGESPPGEIPPFGFLR